MKKKNNIFTDPESLRIVDVKRVIYLVTGSLAFLITELGRFVYRPYIYKNNIQDFGLADSIGNLGGIIVQIFVCLAIVNSPYKKGFNLILFLIAGYILYEFAQPYLPKGTFDCLDVYATVIGGLISLLLYFLIHKSIKQNKTLVKL